MSDQFPFQPATDATPAAWISQNIHGFGASVVSIVPAGFAAYARIYHPASRANGDTRTPLRWAEIAAATGRTTHRQMQWPSIIGRFDERSSPNHPILSDHSFVRPSEGVLPPELARLIWPVLASFTSRPQRCWFAVWDGFSGMYPAVRSGPIFTLPHRQFHLFQAPIDAIETSFSPPPFTISANLWWSDDRSWCVATEIDLVSTYVGGSAEAIAALASAPELEIDLVEPSDGVSWRSDTINPPPSGAPA